MKLSDVVQRMQSNSSYGHDGDFTASYMRLACEAMAKEIVPEIEENKYHHNSGCDCPICQSQATEKSVRDEILKNIAEFMGRKNEN